ncbi:MAG TPA: hypothetical protein VMB50_21720 [Myxococcales bacterium]|nr:hypothetical protein [Myxococcales bacterium]
MEKLAMAAALAALMACATTVPEHHPSAEAYDQRAAAARAEAARQERAYDPAAGVRRSTCEGKGDFSGVCWTSERNPTEGHRLAAARLRREAAHDRAISRKLRDAEAKSCQGVSDADRDEGPFIHYEDIDSVTPLYGQRGKSTSPQLLGAVITFRPVWGLTVDFLRRVVDCHLARSNALGNELPDMPDCPMGTPGTQASVAGSADGFSITLTSDDPASAREILRRAMLLVAPPGAPTSER